MAARKSTNIVQVKLRIPEKLRRQVLEAAKKSGRSLNGELSHLIEEALVRPVLETALKRVVDKAAFVGVVAAMKAAGWTPPHAQPELQPDQKASAPEGKTEKDQ